MKLCKDCKHIVLGDFKDKKLNLSWAKCGREQTPTDPVTGRPPKPKYFCSTERSSPSILSILYRECGQAGRYFEPKQ